MVTVTQAYAISRLEFVVESFALVSRLCLFDCLTRSVCKSLHDMCLGLGKQSTQSFIQLDHPPLLLYAAP